MTKLKWFIEQAQSGIAGLKWLIGHVQNRLLVMFWAGDHFILAVFTLGNCKPYEMISSALWSLDQDGKLLGRILRPTVDVVLRFIGPNHCERSYRWQIHLYSGKHA